MKDLITEARELCADTQLEAALLELKTMSGWLNKVVYHKLGIRWSFDNNNLIHWIVVFMRLLPELCDALEKAEAKIESIHKSLDFAETQRQGSKNYTELAINNGLALGRIAVIVQHDFEPLPAQPEEGE